MNNDEAKEEHYIPDVTKEVEQVEDSEYHARYARRNGSLGRYIGSTYVALLGAAAVTASTLAAVSCAFFSYSSLDGVPWRGLTPPFDELSEASIGFFHYSELEGSDTLGSAFLGDNCIRYDDWQEVGQTKLFYAAQFCGMVAPIVGFLAWLQVVLEMMCCRIRGFAAYVSFLFFAATALQASTFLLFGDAEFCFAPESQNKCSLKVGAWYSVGATIAYMILAVVISFVPPYPVIGRSWCFLCTSCADPDDAIFTESEASDSAGSLGQKSQLSERSYDMCDEENPNDEGNPNSSTAPVACLSSGGLESVDVWGRTPESGANVDQEQVGSVGADGVAVGSTKSPNNLDQIVGKDTESVADPGGMDHSGSWALVDTTTSDNSTQILSYVAVDNPRTGGKSVEGQAEPEVTQNGSVGDGNGTTIPATKSGDGNSTIGLAPEHQSVGGTGAVVEKEDKSPDFFDMACCGDPLQLETYLKTSSPKRKKNSKQSLPKLPNEQSIALVNNGSINAQSTGANVTATSNEEVTNMASEPQEGSEKAQPSSSRFGFSFF